MKQNGLIIPHSFDEIKRCQEERLSATLQYLQDNSAFYARMFRENNIEIRKIKSLNDLKKIPFTSKKDLQQFNDDFICVATNKIIDYVTTSGTLGEPVTFILTENDLERLAYNEFRSLSHASITANEKVQLTVTLDKMFMAGLAYFAGLRKIGAGSIRLGPGSPELQWKTIFRFSPEILIAVPSFVIKLIDYAIKMDIDFKNSSVKKIICIGEPIRNQDFTANSIAKKILSQWGVKLFSTYAATEICTAFTECEYGCGGHSIPELAIVECIDDYGLEVDEGLPGEIVISTLGVEGLPLLRFKTGDIGIVHKGTCACGRNTLRIGPIAGRKNQMIKYKGTTLYPPALNEILNGIENIEMYYTEVSENEFGLDHLTTFIFTNADRNELKSMIEGAFRARLRVVPEIKFIDKVEMEKIKFNINSRKPVDFIDLRK